MVENLQKENFGLKLKIFYLQEGVNKSKTGSVDEIINEVYLSQGKYLLLLECQC